MKFTIQQTITKEQRESDDFKEIYTMLKNTTLPYFRDSLPLENVGSTNKKTILMIKSVEIIFNSVYYGVWVKLLLKDADCIYVVGMDALHLNSKTCDVYEYTHSY